MRLSLRPRAELDIDGAYAWYQSRQEGLGDIFLRSVDACFDRLCREPEMYALKHGRIRLGLLITLNGL